MPNRRKPQNYFPSPKFQFKFLRFLLFGATLQMTLVCCVIYFFLRENYDLLVKYSGASPELSRMLYSELRVMISLIGVTFFGYLLALAYLGVIFSHRVVGLAVALHRTIRLLRDGKDVKLTLRKGDEFQELVTDFNEMVENLRKGKSTSAA